MGSSSLGPLAIHRGDGGRNEIFLNDGFHPVIQVQWSVHRLEAAGIES